jgi:anti-sigma factor RsiW
MPLAKRQIVASSSGSTRAGEQRGRRERGVSPANALGQIATPVDVESLARDATPPTDLGHRIARALRLAQQLQSQVLHRHHP